MGRTSIGSRSALESRTGCQSVGFKARPCLLSFTLPDYLLAHRFFPTYYMSSSLTICIISAHSHLYVYTTRFFIYQLDVILSGYYVASGCIPAPVFLIIITKTIHRSRALVLSVHFTEGIFGGLAVERSRILPNKTNPSSYHVAHFELHISQSQMPSHSFLLHQCYANSR